ncbi:LOW QUALITY PROTEIN: melanoma-associated antigen B2-like [Trichechus manatus latirostris]|uniref:LOW QUALITY PROTEIN: melanoma-associated antigen B2-like n=1 Tax=Trichechus manatus latirostris TaxID=127582 RepID=A0A2Y9E340_TRIMA|nr:LOW QUALITY PROTEIN: melanoma-associated antigen B2-like [Trichechus manatus latirostris]
MPRGQKSKLRAREKRRQARGDTHGVQGAQATAAEEEGSPSSSSPPFGGSPQSSPAAHIPQGPPRVPFITTAAAGASGTRAAGDAKSQDEGGPSSSVAPPSAGSSQKDPLARQAGMLMQFLLHKYKMKEPVTKAEMMKSISKKYKERFPEILKKTTERMELVFGLDLKEVDPSRQSYALVSKLDITNEESLNDGGEFPKNGLLMPLLGVIFMKGNRATEEEIWEFLNVLGVYDGRRHLIFGEPRKLITKDLVQEKYLEYRQVPNSDPPRNEFLWGPRAYAETSKMKVLEFLAKINDTVPSAFPLHYEEALRDEEESPSQSCSQGWSYCKGQCLFQSHIRQLLPPLVKSEADYSLCGSKEKSEF